MGPVCYCVYTVVGIVLLAVPLSFAGEHRRNIYMERSPEPIAVPIGDEVTLECEMNIKADDFRWRHYPISAPYSNVPVKLDKDLSYAVPMHMYKNSGKSTTLLINVNSSDAAGDYQCFAWYGTSVLASIPGRITIAEIGKFPPAKENRRYTVVAGNSVAIRCDLPPSNPPPSVEYYRNNLLVDSLILPTSTLLLENVSKADSGEYHCTANNYITGETIQSNQVTFLTVLSNTSNLFGREEVRFLSKPPSNYTATAGQTIFMECSAIGNPPPKVVWRKLVGVLDSRRTRVLPGGLQITNVTAKDEGIYICEHGSLNHSIMLYFYEKPTVEFSGLLKTTEGENVIFNCTVTGTPEPIISWFINGHSILNDSNIEVIGNTIYFSPLEKRHAGILQCFASNVVGTTTDYAFLQIYPKQVPTPNEPTTQRTRHRTDKPKKTRGKNLIMVPPSKPNVTRLSDESVMVRWDVPENDGLPIQFFKVQYRELGTASQSSKNKGSRWKTTNADIIPHLRSYQVDNLKPDHIYRFRIAAVYSNNDNKLGLNSAKFHLKREDFFTNNPLPTPKLTRTEALSPYNIKIYWDYIPNPNVTIDGFYVNYQLTSSAGEYYKATVDGEQTKSYVINHLQPDTAYDIKLQSFTASGVSEFSAVLQQKTQRLPDAEVTSVPPLPKKEERVPSQLYIFIGAGVLVGCLLIAGIIIFIICKKKKEKEANGLEDNDRTDKIGGPNEDRRHHIQVDANGYIAKAIPRGLSNGCGPLPNRITITPNPLADADDNQNQNMIEMSCLSSQNNNCSTVEASASNETTQPLTSKLKSPENIKTRGKLKPELTAGENYV